MNYVITKKKTSIEIISAQVVSNKPPRNYLGSMLEVLKNVVKRRRIEQEDEETRVFRSGKKFKRNEYRQSHEANNSRLNENIIENFPSCSYGPSNSGQITTNRAFQKIE